MEEYQVSLNWRQSQDFHCDLVYIIISVISQKRLRDASHRNTFPIMDQRMDLLIHKSESRLADEMTPV